MYSRAFVRDGDTTTKGGVVRVPANLITTGDPPKYVCFEGDPVYCPACNCVGVTKCVPPFRSWVGLDGRQVNLDGDLCICNCPISPRLRASSSDMEMTFHSHELERVKSIIPWIVCLSDKNEDYEISFDIVEADTKIPVKGMEYKLVSGGKPILDKESLTNGGTRSLPLLNYPDLEFSAWIRGGSNG